MKRSLAAALAAALTLTVAACGGSSHHHKAHATAGACSQAANGHGSPGLCAPAPIKHGLALTAPHATGSPQFEDLSNNDPCYCGTTIRARGMSGLIVKANQGTGFRDWTAAPMIRSARAAGLAVGLYDFDQDYTVAEAQVFVSQAQAAGVFPSTPNTFPLYLDVEYGNFNYSGLQAQIAYLRSQGYRVGIYTGDWYWAPHAGCQWPAGVTAWLSGYPSAVVPCGLPGSLFQAHQYTDSPVDTSVFLGSTDQFAAFTQTHVGPSPDQVSRWVRARGSSLHAYYAHHCTRPVLGPGVCGMFAWRVDHFQRLIDTADGYNPRCFGPHRNLGAAECQIVRPATAIRSRALSSTVSAEGHQGCESARGPVRNRVCDALRARDAHFRRVINRSLATSRL